MGCWLESPESIWRNYRSSWKTWVRKTSKNWEKKTKTQNILRTQTTKKRHGGEGLDVFVARAQGNRRLVREKRLEENFQFCFYLPMDCLDIIPICFSAVRDVRTAQATGDIEQQDCNWWRVWLTATLGHLPPQSSFSKPSNRIYKPNRMPLSKLLIQNSLKTNLWLEDLYGRVNMILGGLGLSALGPIPSLYIKWRSIAS